MVEDYRTGDDCILEFVGLRYAFSRADFAERVSVAARRLELIDNGPDDDTLADLVDLAARGTLDEPRSAVGRRAQQLGDELVYWLRKLVFRSAWLDARVKAGLIEARYAGRGRFRYQLDGHDLPLATDDDIPSFAAPALPGGRNRE